ncbi:hypothetical protein HZA57_06700, partial [Candidatus Poribacteria bacterium]|nr:hypothetical protein [Candidatus Poribacteria bacterium]
EASKLEPDNGEIQLRWGNALMAEKQFHEAESRFRIAQNLLKNDPRPGNNLGALMLQRKDYRSSIRELEGVVGRHPEFAPARLNLALAMEEAGYDRAQIRTHLEEYLRLGGEKKHEVENWLAELGK